MFKGDQLGPVPKIIGGAFIVGVSLYYIIAGIPGYLEPGWPALLTVIKGAVPLLLIILGIFIIWLEWDEWKIEKELREEERKSRATRRRKRKR